MLTSLQGIVLAIAVLFYAAALGGLPLRWLRTRDETCGRCAHPIAAGQSERCVECGSSLDAARRRRFEPRWIRRVQALVGGLGLAGMVWVAFTVLDRPRLAINDEWSAWVQWGDGAESKLVTERRSFAELDGTAEVVVDGIFFQATHRNDAVRRFHTQTADGRLRVQFLDENERPVGAAAMVADDRELATLLHERAVFPIPSLAAHFAAVAHYRGTTQSPGPVRGSEWPVTLPELAADAPEVAGFGASSGAIPSPHRATRVAWTVTTILFVVCGSLLLIAMFWRIDGVGAPRGATDAPLT